MTDIKRLVGCFDGTWNTDRSNTNVSRLYRKVADEATGSKDQRRFYDEGVGTKWGERVRGGALGMGLDENIRRGYAWFASQFWTDGGLDQDDYLRGPDLFLFGFSRGAFTARSLAGMIGYLGLPKLAESGGAADKSLHETQPITDAWRLYEARPTEEERKAVAEGTGDAALKQRVGAHDEQVAAFRTAGRYRVRIHFVGVWDTVGALGIPKILDYDWIPRPSNHYQFHNTQLGPAVRYAYHAVAIDENRENYDVTLWTSMGPTNIEVEQRWFPGAHADVGGGYDDDLLPDPPLKWMADKAADRGLEFVNDRRKVDPATGRCPDAIAEAPAAFDIDGHEYLSPVHDSYAEFLGGTYRALRSLPGAGGRFLRRMLVAQDGLCQTVDETAYKKVDAQSAYRPVNLAQAGRVS